MTKEEYIQRRKNGETKEQIVSSWQQGKENETGVTAEEWKAYADYLSGSEKYGSGSAYYTSLGQDMWVKAYVTAESAAKEMGLDPESKAGQLFVTEYQNRLLNNNPQYAQTISMRDSERGKEEAENLKQKSIREREFTDQYGKYLGNSIDPTTGMSYEDLNAQAAQSKTDVSDWWTRMKNGVGQQIDSFKSGLAEQREYNQNARDARKQGVVGWANPDNWPKNQSFETMS